MESVETPEQWASMQASGHVPTPIDVGITPTIKRSDGATIIPTSSSLTRNVETHAKPLDAKENQNEIAPEATGITEPPEPLGIQLPPTEGMGAREAKTELLKWAKLNFGVKIDRRPALSEVIKACKELAMRPMNKAVGQ
jgi:hypothetical protein